MKLYRMRARVAREQGTYTDLAIIPVIDAETEDLEMFDLNSTSRATVDKARRQVQQRRRARYHCTTYSCRRVGSTQSWSTKSRSL
jgi:hypothetical protein